MEIKYRLDLYKLLPPNPVTVELGVAEGCFSRDILTVWKPKIHYMVDMWECHPEFKGDAGFEQEWHNNNYESVKKLTEAFENKVILRGPTVAMAQKVNNGTCNIVYIDACHSYECVKNDIHAWWPKLKKGGVMAFHDYECTDYGVKQAVNEFAESRSLKVYLLPENAIKDAGAYLIKPK